MMLTEKYRPKTFREIVGNKETVKVVKASIREKHRIHYLFYGPPGTGKTTIARVIADTLKADMMMLNASDERGIEVIRGKVKEFVRTKSFYDEKIVFLDEADGLTSAAQDSLKSIIENYSHNCIFILTANNLGKIIPAIQERPQVLRMSYLSAKEILPLLQRINKNEAYGFEDDVLLLIAEKSRGSARKAVHGILRVILQFKRGATIDKIEKMYGKDPINKLVNMLVVEKALRKSLKYALEITSDFPIRDLFIELLFAIEDKDQDPKTFAQIAMILGDHDYRINQAADEIGTLYSAISAIYLVVKHGN